ncbi:LysR family transcriptional regulator [Streptomyces wuyuanensis]
MIGFSRAASELDCARSGVTGRTRGLERSLGVELFERFSCRGRAAAPW